jgi:hypothetical protein
LLQKEKLNWGKGKIAKLLNRKKAKKQKGEKVGRQICDFAIQRFCSYAISQKK